MKDTNDLIAERLIKGATMFLYPVTEEGTSFTIRQMKNHFKDNFFTYDEAKKFEEKMNSFFRKNHLPDILSITSFLYELEKQNQVERIVEGYCGLCKTTHTITFEDKKQMECFDYIPTSKENIKLRLTKV